MPSFIRVIKDFDMRLDHEEIDEFLGHLKASLGHRLQVLNEELSTLSEGQFEDPLDIYRYQEHLLEQIFSAQNARDLGDELSVIALYKKIETKTCRIIKHRISAAASKNLSYYKQLREALPFDLDAVHGFSSFNELRLINNSIKHDGVVSQDLADNFPVWTVGAELTELGRAFARILPGAKNYVSDLVEKVYAHGDL